MECILVLVTIIHLNVKWCKQENLRFHKLSFRPFQTRICLVNTQVNRTKKVFFQICVFSKFLFLSTPKSQANLHPMCFQLNLNGP
jgi:hypothetical protein